MDGGTGLYTGNWEQDHPQKKKCKEKRKDTKAKVKRHKGKEKTQRQR